MRRICGGETLRVHLLSRVFVGMFWMSGVSCISARHPKDGDPRLSAGLRSALAE